MPTGIPGSPWQPYEDTLIRLRRWRQLASTGMPVAEIAAAIGVSRAALDQMVVRARRHGHPDAIRHPLAGGSGLWHLYDSRGRRSRIARSLQGVSS